MHATEIQENAVLIMGSDGLWDVITNIEAVQIVLEVMKRYSKDDYKRYQWLFIGIFID